MLKIGTLFSGGLAAVEFALRYEELEHDIVFACEWDKFARKQYEHFHGLPTSCFYEDVSFMDGTPYLDTLDLMVWGSPCQDLSLAGKRKGFDGAKSSLFREGARIMSEVMPKAFIFENVKGLLSSNGGADYKEVIKTFQDMGYLIAMKVMNTKDYGVPQNRERVFIVGFLDANDYHSFSFENGFELETRLKHYLDERVDEKYYLSSKLINGFLNKNERYEKEGKAKGFTFKPADVNTHASCLNARYYESGAADIYIDEAKLNQVGTLDIKGNDSINTLYAVNGLCPTLTTMGGGNREPKIAQNIKPSVRDNFYRDYEKILNSDKPIFYSECKSGYQDNKVCLTESACLRANNDNLFTLDKNFLIRKLTPKECFKLQGVKESCIDLVVSDSQAYKIAGNAISVNVMQSLLRSLYKPVSKKDTLF